MKTIMEFDEDYQDQYMFEQMRKSAEFVNALNDIGMALREEKTSFYKDFLKVAKRYGVVDFLKLEFSNDINKEVTT